MVNPVQQESSSQAALQTTTRALTSSATWYKDAIIYEVHVRAFCDSVTDGMGDFGGLTQKLGYVTLPQIAAFMQQREAAN